MLTERGSRFPSGSVSLAATSTAAAVSSALPPESALATGGSLTAPVARVAVAVAHRPVVSQTR
jgi:hypothetical protein